MTERAASRTVLVVERAEAILELPAVYADVLRWRAAGVPQATIAERLAVLPDTVPILVRVAEAKLLALLAKESPDAGAP